MTDFQVPAKAYHELPAEIRSDRDSDGVTDHDGLIHLVRRDVNHDGQVDRLSYDIDGDAHFDLVKEDDNVDFENSFRY
jgi:hypothetical protein